MRIEVLAPDGVGEVAPGDDLAALALRHCDLRDGDLLVVTSKVVSKAEGRLVAADDRTDAIDREQRRVLARRGPTRIVENAFGMVQAAAGVDASNVPAGTVALLPADPDASARSLRAALAAAGVRVAVVLTDTFGRAWREGQTDLAIGAAGLEPLHDLAGRTDAHGHALAVTAPATADALASAADLVKGKLGGRPFAVVRGLEHLVLDDDGPGAGVLVRPREQDMFALGAREAVVAALLGQDADCFGAPAPVEELEAALRSLGLDVVRPDEGALDVTADPRVAALAHAHAWRVEATAAGEGIRVRLRPRRP